MEGAAMVAEDLGANSVTRADLMKEIDEKLARVHKFLMEEKLGGVLLTRVDNFAWVTAGLGDNHIIITSEVGGASLLILRDGGRFLVASNVEVPRLMETDLKGLGYIPRDYLWYEDKTVSDVRLKIIQDLAKGQEIGTDVPLPGLRFIAPGFARLRYVLTDSEIKKYRWLGRNSSEAVSAVCRRIEPGMSERQIESLTSDELMRRGIRPTVLLVGVDGRTLNYGHDVPSDAKLEKYAFVNVCGRKWGLIASVGRYVHFGPLPVDLKERMHASGEISARLQASSRPGMRAGDMFDLAKKWYAEEGFPDGWMALHVGGAIGYAEREWVAYPGLEESVHERQAFAWNPLVRGAISFDTVVVYKDYVENLTSIPDWPSFVVNVDGKEYRMPDILVR
jgi:antitoxin VapB